MFLLALVCSKWASKLLAITHDPTDIIFTKSGVWLKLHKSFVAKTQSLNCDSKPFFLPSLEPFSGRNTPDRLLCPVYMLKLYLSFTGGVEKTYTCLKNVSEKVSFAQKLCHPGSKISYTHMTKIGQLILKVMKFVQCQLHGLTLKFPPQKKY